MLTLTEQINHSTGTYFSIQPSVGSRMLLNSVISEYGIKNPIPLNKIHVTIIHSKKPCPTMRFYTPDMPIWGVANRFELFGTKVGTKCLVLIIDSPKINFLYDELQIYEPTTDFPTYRAHMSLTYNFEGECPHLKEPVPIRFDTHECVPIED